VALEIRVTLALSAERSQNSAPTYSDADRARQTLSTWPVPFGQLDMDSPCHGDVTEVRRETKQQDGGVPESELLQNLYGVREARQGQALLQQRMRGPRTSQQRACRWAVLSGNHSREAAPRGPASTLPRTPSPRDASTSRGRAKTSA